MYIQRLLDLEINNSSRQSSRSWKADAVPFGECCWMVFLATHCHTHYHLHPFHFVLFKATSNNAVEAHYYGELFCTSTWTAGPCPLPYPVTLNIANIVLCYVKLKCSLVPRFLPRKTFLGRSLGMNSEVLKHPTSKLT